MLCWDADALMVPGHSGAWVWQIPGVGLFHCEQPCPGPFHAIIIFYEEKSFGVFGVLHTIREDVILYSFISVCNVSTGIKPLWCFNWNNYFFSSDFQDIPYSDWCEQTIHNPLEVVPSKFSGISGCSDGVSQEGSASSTKSTELLLGESSDSDPIIISKTVISWFCFS